MIDRLAAIMATACAQHTPILHESQVGRDGSPAPVIVAARSSSSSVTPPARPRGTSMFTQVNLDADGMDIIGDAANEPTIAVDPRNPNRIVIGWRQFDTIESNFREAGYAYSRDGGRTWTASVLEEDVFRTDPVIRSDDGGRFYFLNLDARFYCDMFTSDDAGRSWEGPFAACGGDKAWFAIDLTGGPAHGSIYQAWNTAGNNYGQRQFNRSLDGGRTWSEPQFFIDGIAARPVFGTIAVGVDGAVHVAGINNGTNSTVARVVTSMDVIDPLLPVPTFNAAAITAPEDTRFRVILGGGPNFSGLHSQLDIEVNHAPGPDRGTIYLLTPLQGYFGTADGIDLAMYKSTDGGMAWTGPMRVTDTPTDQTIHHWFGTLAIAPNGRLDVVWNDNRDAAPDVRHSRTYYSSSDDGGASWTASRALTPAWDSWIGWPSQNKIGDYYDLASDNVGAHLAFSTTLNGGQDVYYMRIGDYDCDTNSIPDSDDIASGRIDSNLNGILDDCECPTDINDDTRIDLVDLFEFLEGWFIGDADFTGDGVTDIRDVLLFVEGWLEKTT